MNCFKRLGENVMARTFERQVTELNIRATPAGIAKNDATNAGVPIAAMKLISIPKRWHPDTGPLEPPPAPMILMPKFPLCRSEGLSTDTHPVPSNTAPHAEQVAAPEATGREQFGQ